MANSGLSCFILFQLFLEVCRSGFGFSRSGKCLGSPTFHTNTVNGSGYRSASLLLQISDDQFSSSLVTHDTVPGVIQPEGEESLAKPPGSPVNDFVTHLS